MKLKKIVRFLTRRQRTKRKENKNSAFFTPKFPLSHSFLTKPFCPNRIKTKTTFSFLKTTHPLRSDRAVGLLDLLAGLVQLEPQRFLFFLHLHMIEMLLDQGQVLRANLLFQLLDLVVHDLELALELLDAYKRFFGEQSAVQK